jgi:hypothetical protein
MSLWTTNIPDAQRAGELQGALALDAVHREQEGRQDVLEAHLAEGEDRAGRHRELPAADLALEAPAPNLPTVRVRAADAGRPSLRLRPADDAEGPV